MLKETITSMCQNEQLHYIKAEGIEIGGLYQSYIYLKNTFLQNTTTM